jgi:hypothetical protein
MKADTMNKPRELPPLDELNRLFVLDPQIGSGLRRRITIGPKVARSPVGSMAGSKTPLGYYRVCINGKSYSCHRIVLSIASGKLVHPEELIDHRDGNPENNSSENLRRCTQGENFQNLATRNISSKSGLRGVFEFERRWLSTIYVNRKRIRLGSFGSPEEAHQAYLDAKKKYHPFNPVARDAA